MRNIYNETLKSLQNKLTEDGFKAFNARQIYEWIYKKKVTDFNEMSNLSKKLRDYLNDEFIVGSLKIHTKQVASDQTTKYLFELDDKHFIEAVLMYHDYGNSLCVTTQVGCNIGCSFCASGLQKRVRNLSTAEIVMQLVEVEKDLDLKISHVVLMGTGEPFDNYDHSMAFIDVINSPYGLEIGARHITVSTSGIVPKIYAFAEEKKQVNLAISLHAPDNVTRSRLMKINDVYPVETLIEAVKHYIDKTNRRVTFEYILLEGENDGLDQADQLSDLLRGINCYVNLIRYNAVSEFDYKGSSEPRASAFYNRLMKRGIQCTLRREKGGDIDAACGQLRTKEMKKEG